MSEYDIDEVRRRLARKIDVSGDLLKEVGMVVRLMKHLRAPDGCPWDREQTHKSLLGNLLEEAYEFIDTVERDGDEMMCAELGDLFMQVVFHAQIASERGGFDLGDVARCLVDKLIRRHRHVFGDRTASSPREALEHWNHAKRSEGRVAERLEAVPRAMPALLRARKVQEKASLVGFDWRKVDGAVDKIEEELGEFKRALASGRREQAGRELGDLLFAVVNAARFAGQCPEVALSEAVNRFQRRFRHIESRLAERGLTPEAATLEEMDALWDEAKEKEED